MGPSRHGWQAPLVNFAGGDATRRSAGSKQGGVFAEISGDTNPGTPKGGLVKLPRTLELRA